MQTIQNAKMRWGEIASISEVLVQFRRVNFRLSGGRHMRVGKLASRLDLLAAWRLAQEFQWPRLHFRQTLCDNAFGGRAQCACACAAAAAEPQFSDVFVAGRDQFPSIRITAVVATKNGVLRAFAEGRPTAADQASNQIVLKRSPDGGKTWGALQIVAADGANSLNNPTALLAQSRGRAFLIYQRIPGHLTERSKEITTGFDGTNVYRNFLVWSDDDGGTWPVKKVLWPGSFAYSVLTRLPDGTLGCLFETDGTERIVFARFSLAWLTERTRMFVPGEN